MSEQNKIQLFENQPIRTAWNEEQEEWYFSVVDVIHVLTGSENPRRYWSDLKRKLKSEGATQLYENIGDFTIPSICSPVMKQARVSFKLWLFRTTA